MPENGIEFKTLDKLLTADEIIRIIKVTAQYGVSKVRFTGGEPLLRKNIGKIIQSTSEIHGINSIHLTTNGILLDKFVHSDFFQNIDGINFSLDTLQAEKFKSISRRDKLPIILENIQKSLEIGVQNIKLNMVVLRDFNSDEIIDFVEFTKNNKVTVRFVELMPFDDYQIWKTGKFMSSEHILETLRNAYPNLSNTPGTKTEHYHFSLPGYNGNFAVIPAYTRSLCANCNRIRLTADGRILNCLYSNNEFNLRDLMRDGCSDEELIDSICLAMKLKYVDGFEAQRESENKRSSMTQIGG
jgi:cyclic pyranopterin phosphate synthase